jgi:hypothetical protein
VRVAVVILAAFGSNVLIAAPGSQAQSGDPPSTWVLPITTVDSGDDTENPSLTISADELVLTGGGTRAAPGNTRPRECTVRAWNGSTLSAARPVRDQLSAVDTMVEGEQYYVECTWLDTGVTDYAEVFTYQPGQAGPSLDAIARRVYDEVPLAYPSPATSPAIDLDQLTGLPTWLWVDPAGFETFQASETLAGITVTVTATPEHVTWDPGDGSDPIVCDGPGTPYDHGVDDAAQSTDCSHIYQFVSADQPDGVYHASAAITWSVAWTAGDWGGGTLPDATRTTTFDLTVTERQAVVTYDP